jgi:hypothetical protein
MLLVAAVDGQAELVPQPTVEEQQGLRPHQELDMEMQEPTEPVAVVVVAKQVVAV